MVLWRLCAQNPPFTGGCHGHSRGRFRLRAVPRFYRPGFEKPPAGVAGARMASVGFGSPAKMAVFRAQFLHGQLLKGVAGKAVCPKSGGAVGPVLLQSHVVS